MTMNRISTFCFDIKLKLWSFVFAALFCVAVLSTSSTSLAQQLSMGSTMAKPTDLIKVPRLRQATDYTCGVCALQAVLAYYGDDVREDVLARALKANTKDGTRYKEIADYSRKHGYTVEIKKEAETKDLEGMLKSGRPAICLIQAWADRKATAPKGKVNYSERWQDGHYVVAVGFDKDNFYFMDPSTVGTYTFIKRGDFAERWHDTDGHERLNHFAMAISKNKPYDPDAITEIE
jgi:predicted double-glycine peptidase